VPPRVWSIRIKDILEAIARIERFTTGMTYEQFVTDEKTHDAVVRNFTVIGEVAAKVPESIQLLHPDVPWNKIVGMRNFLVHEYFGISTQVLWTTVQQDLLVIRFQLAQLLDRKDA
jgi:uncharacterized protein with HEPN domain